LTTVEGSPHVHLKKFDHTLFFHSHKFIMTSFSLAGLANCDNKSSASTNKIPPAKSKTKKDIIQYFKFLFKDLI
jgi:hypothetical protein